MDLVACPSPDCDLPAEVLDRVALPSTDGPVEHVRLVCLDGHRFFMPTLMLPEPTPVGAVAGSGLRGIRTP